MDEVLGPLRLLESCSTDAINPSVRLLSSHSFETVRKDFPRILRLSSDGQCIVVGHENNSVSLHSLPEESFLKHRYYSSKYEQSGLECQFSDGKGSIPPLTLKPTQSWDIGETIYDLQCPPMPTSSDQNGTRNRFLVSSRDHPIHLYDSSTGNVLSSYIPHNHLDELDISLSLAFNLQGNKIYSGADRRIYCFDIMVPGRPCSAMATSSSKKSYFGQKGLISTIQFNPDYSGLYAAGSFLGNVSIYAENVNTSCLDIAHLGYAVCHTKWSPCGRYLWIGGRMSDTISCWDIRFTKKLVNSVKRQCRTNQRMSFDIDPWGNYLATGDDEGNALIYSTSTFDLIKQLHADGSDGCRKSKLNLNGCLFHPYYAILLGTQGERVFDDYDSYESDQDSIDGNEQKMKKRKMFNNDQIPSDSTFTDNKFGDKGQQGSLYIWAMNKVPLYYEDIQQTNSDISDPSQSEAAEITFTNDINAINSSE